MKTSFYKKQTSTSKLTCTSFAKGSKHLGDRKPYAKEFFADLIKLETEFYGKNYSVDTLDKLVQHYAKAVEYYDSVQDEISTYFAFKIQDILATKLSLAMLTEFKNNALDKKQSMISTMPNRRASLLADFGIQREILGEESPITKIEKSRREEWEKKKSVAEKSLASIRNEKQRFVDLFARLEAEKLNQQQDMHNILNQHVKTVQRNDSLVQTNLDKQKDRLRKKLEQRKAESAMSYTMNNSMNSFGGCKSFINLSECNNKKDFLNVKRLDSMLSDSMLSDLDDLDGLSSNKKEKFAVELQIPNHRPRVNSLFFKKEAISESKSLSARGPRKDNDEDEKYPRAKLNSSVSEEKLSTEDSFNNEVNADFSALNGDIVKLTV